MHKFPRYRIKLPSHLIGRTIPPTSSYGASVQAEENCPFSWGLTDHIRSLLVLCIHLTHHLSWSHGITAPGIEMIEVTIPLGDIVISTYSFFGFCIHVRGHTFTSQGV